MKIAIIGAGISGLVVGYELLKRGYDIEIFEKANEVGGLGAPWRKNGYLIEKTYHAFFKGDTDLLNLINELGLGNKIKWFKAKIGLLSDNKIRNFSSPFRILTNGMLSIPDIWHFGKMYLKLNKHSDYMNLEEITTKDYIINTASKNLYYKVFKPLLQIKWGDVFDEVSAAWLWGRIVPRSKSRNKSLSSEKLGTLKDGGYAIITEKLCKILQQKAKINLDSQVIKIENDKKENKWILKYKNSRKENNSNNRKLYDAIISTIPTELLIEMCLDLKEKRNYKNKIEYQGIICFTIGMKKRMTNYYQVPIHSNMNSFIGGIVEHTNLIPETFYNCDHILYVFSYIDQNSELFDCTEEELEKKYVSELERIFPKKFSGEKIKWINLLKTKYATPIFKLNYSKFMPEIKGYQQGLYQIGLFNVYPISDYNLIIKKAIETATIISTSEITKNFRV